MLLKREITENVILSPQEIGCLLENCSIEELESALGDMLSSNDQEVYSAASRFIRDTINYNVTKGHGKRINEDYGSFRFHALIEDGLFCDDGDKRSDCAYTLGKICSQASIPKFKEAITKFEEEDPDYAVILKEELSWIQNSTDE